LHPEYGVGLDAMDGKRRIKAPTIAKRAIAKQIELENLGEELRVLYVALTRAKEKLILTGSKKDILAKAESYAQDVQMLNLKAGQLLPYLSRESAVSYLDWLLPAMLSYGDKYPITCVAAEELVTEEVEKQVVAAQQKAERMAEIQKAPDVLIEVLENRFAEVYPYEIDDAKKNKYSVSELKHRAMRAAFEAEDADTMPMFAEEVVVPYVPKFMQEQMLSGGTGEHISDEVMTDKQMHMMAGDVNEGALRGTAVHRVMECYDFTSEASPMEQLQLMQSKGRITQELSKLVQLSKVQAFVESETGARMKCAAQVGKLYREKPFVMSFSEEDMTLIQGIIDVFWVEEDGIVLLDYKTDAVAQPQELILRYEEQLNLYADALNRVFADTGLKVKEKLIYAFKFDEVIKV
ncbi:MAG: PD-(D/E)XK nuclease family protein, partial [Lachnospiraceae bacterium]|nr:PD-(D/E)XK nuclease family protein [Lachnospiraceae bacterium]